MPSLDTPPSTIRLRDGRLLAYAEYGDATGFPVCFMHGVPSSRLAAVMLADGALRHGVRLISPDRPGYGHSDPLPGRSILDWADDVEQLADALGLHRFGVLGVSGAVPYILASALRLPHRIPRAVILSGLGPLESPELMQGMHRESAALYRLALRTPRLGRVWMKMLGRTVRASPQLVLRQQMRYLPPVDRAIFERPGMKEIRLADIAEAFRSGSGGPEQEAELHMTDWGFRLADVPVDVTVWQGELDHYHPTAMGRFLAHELPRSRAVFVPNVGAFGFVDCLGEIFAEFTATALARPNAEPEAAS